MRHKLLWYLLALCAKVEFENPGNSEILVLTTEKTDSAKKGHEKPKNDAWEREEREQRHFRRTPRQRTRAVCGPSMALPAIVPSRIGEPAEADFAGVPAQTAFCRPRGGGGRPCPPPPRPRHPAPSPAIRRVAAGIGSGTARSRPASDGVPPAATASRSPPRAVSPAATICASAAHRSRRPLIAAEASLSPFRLLTTTPPSAREKKGGQGGSWPVSRSRKKGGRGVFSR